MFRSNLAAAVKPPHETHYKQFSTLLRERAIGAVTRCMTGAMLLLATSGCSTTRFTQTAGQFGALTRSAAEQQNEGLGAVAADEIERYRQSLAETKTELRFRDCARTLADVPPDPESALVKPFPRCRLTERVSQGEFRELAPDVRFENITTLNSALVDYASGLVLLAADASEDQQTFTASVSNLASSIGGLDGAIRKVTGSSEEDSAAKLNAVGTLVAKLGNLYFAARRQSVLKHMIIEADPLVQRSAAILGDADSQLDLYDRLPLYEAVVKAQQNADEVRAGGDVTAIRSAQDKLFTAVERFNAYQIDRSRFAAIGAAHAKLVEAAKAGATIKELHEAIVAIVDLASTIGETKSAFETEKQ